MLVQLLLLATVPKQTATEQSPWKPLAGIHKLVDRVDKPGVVAIMDDHRVIVLDVEGKQEKISKLAVGAQPLFYDEGGLAVAPQFDPIAFRPENPVSMKFLAQGRTVVNQAYRYTVFTAKSVFVSPQADRYSGIGIRADGEEICFIELPMNVPLVTRYALYESTWTKIGSTLTPEIPKVGFAMLEQRFNDVRYISKDCIAFVGSFLPYVSRTEKPIDPESLLANSELPISMEKPQGKPSRAYLFVLNLKTWITQVRARLNVDWGRGEPGGPTFGRMSVSTDGKWLFLLGEKGIFRLGTSKLVYGNTKS